MRRLRDTESTPSTLRKSLGHWGCTIIRVDTDRAYGIPFESRISLLVIADARHRDGDFSVVIAKSAAGESGEVLYTATQQAHSLVPVLLAVFWASMGAFRYSKKFRALTFFDSRLHPNLNLKNPVPRIRKIFIHVVAALATT